MPATPSLREVTFSSGNVVLAGSLALPGREVPAPAGRLVEAGRDDSSFAEAARLIDSAGNPSAFTGYWAGMDERLWTFVRRKQDHDPIPDALRLRCPHLAIFGGADQLVPVADSIRLFSDAACHAQRHDRATLTVAVFPARATGSRQMPARAWHPATSTR